MVRTSASQAGNVEFESHIRQLIRSHRINGKFTGPSSRKCWVRVPLGSLWMPYVRVGEEAVLKTVGPLGLQVQILCTALIGG